MRGVFVTLEGGEGVGKSTQARRLAEFLRRCGLGVELTREPGGTPGAEAIRTLLLDNAQDWAAPAEALLFAAARAEHVAQRIEPALVAGRWVVCDRFIDSSRAYQAADANGDAAILALHRFGSKGLLPDCTIVLDAPAALIEARLARRDGGHSDRIGGRSTLYHQQVAERFRAIARAEPQRCHIVDASGSPEEVHAAILALLAPLLERHR